WLAWTVDAQGKDGNGIQLRNMGNGSVQVLDSAQAEYKSLSWTKEGDGLAALKGVEHEDFEDPLYSLLGFKGFDQATPSQAEFDPSQYEGFPAGMTLSPNRRPAWSEDLKYMLFGIHEVEKKEEKEEKEEKGEKEMGQKDDQEAEPGDQSIQARPAGKKTRPGDKKPEPGDQSIEGRPAVDKDRRAAGKGPGGKKEEPVKPDLVIWHWQDERIQSQQQVQERRDQDFSYLAAYHLDDQRFVRLADDSLREVSAEPKHSWAVGTDRSPYQRMGTLDGRRYVDLYAVDIDSGERRLAVEKARWSFGSSPDGKRLLFYEDGHFHVYEMETGRRINLTENVPTSFVDAEDDHNVDRPPVRPHGWSSDSAWVLLSDNWDVWKVPVGEGKAVNLTVNGKKDSIRYQRRYRLDPDEEGTDLSKPVYLRTYGEWTKKGGIARIKDGNPGAEMLLWEDATFPALIKAREAEAFVLSRGTFADYPDFHSADQDLQTLGRLSEANPQQDEFRWSAGSRLIDYTGAKGDRLQAALHLPAGYEPGKRYPTIVYIYERVSRRLNQYSSPSANGFNKSVYTSQGYAVLEPDIAYQVNDPGMSAVWCVLPALQAAIESGVVDGEKVGIHGHSWGGYQTSFLITQSKAFRAAVAGAPLTNMISMYSSIYWNTGSANQPIFESSQGRFTGGYWEVPEAYTRNSPVYFADQVETPLIILHNDKDGAVDWNQGIEYFNTLRRLEKPVVMLQYKGENHGLRKPANRKDYTLRMKAFFDHHLKGSPAPDWLKEGIPHLELEEH
ncbi:MAG: prolyl oligopeptidase family serine peptidase, partial [Acidobacteriota bacterium]